MLLSFRNQSFANRHETMGDIAEAVFDDVYDEQVHDFGLNRFWKNGKRLYMNDMSVAMRYMPDRMTKDRIFEVMGFGRDQTLKVKFEKLQALRRWVAIGPVWLFIYDSANERYWEFTLEALDHAILQHGAAAAFPEGKEYWGIKAEHLPSTPIPYTP